MQEWELIARLTAALTGATLQVYDRIHHFGPFESPDLIADDAAAFLTG